MSNKTQNTLSLGPMARFLLLLHFMVRDIHPFSCLQKREIKLRIREIIKQAHLKKTSEITLLILNTYMTYLLVSYAALFLMFLFYFILVVAHLLVLVNNSDALDYIKQSSLSYFLNFILLYIYIFFF